MQHAKSQERNEWQDKIPAVVKVVLKMSCSTSSGEGKVVHTRQYITLLVSRTAVKVFLFHCHHTQTHTHTHPVEYNMLQENIISCVTGLSPRSRFYTLQSSLYAYLISESTKWIGIKFRINTFAASYLNTQGLNNSCLKSPASTLVDQTFQSRALRSFSLNQLRNLSL